MTESLMQSIGSTIHRFVERRRQEKTRTELQVLDDHALADIGLTRADLDYRENPILARNGGPDWDGKVPRAN